MPWLAPMLSVKTRAMTEIPAEKRSPVRMDGMASGTITLAHQTPAAQAEAARRLDDAAVDVAHAVGGVEVHGEQRGQADEEHLGRLADAEPDDEEEDDGGVGDHAQHLEGRIEQLLAETGQADDDPEDQPEPGAEREAERGAPDRDADVAEQVLVAEQVDEGVPRRGRRGQAWWRGSSRVAVRSHQAAKTETGMRRRSAHRGAGAAGACVTRGRRTRPGPAAPGPAPGGQRAERRAWPVGHGRAPRRRATRGGHDESPAAFATALLKGGRRSPSRPGG